MKARLQFAQAAELFFDFPQESTRQRFESAYEAPVVDGATLINHDLALFAVTGDSPWKRHT
jgi:hypothetical protein